jgi:hypothetical protein
VGRSATANKLYFILGLIDLYICIRLVSIHGCNDIGIHVLVQTLKRQRRTTTPENRSMQTIQHSVHNSVQTIQCSTGVVVHFRVYISITIFLASWFGNRHINADNEVLKFLFISKCYAYNPSTHGFHYLQFLMISIKKNLCQQKGLL